MSSFFPDMPSLKWCTKRKLILGIVLVTCNLFILFLLTSFHLRKNSDAQDMRQLSYSSRKEKKVDKKIKVPVKWSLLHAVDSLPLKLVPESTILLEDLYFTPAQHIYHVYNDTMLIQPQEGCNGPDQLLILIPSPPESGEARQTIRETWGSVGLGQPWPFRSMSYSVKVVFVLGLENDTATEPEESNDQAFKQSPAQEHFFFKDILQFEMIDSYYNLTRKMIQALQWAWKSCGEVKYIVKADEDVFVNLPMVATMLKYYGEENSIYGNIYWQNAVERKGKWGVDKSVYPLGSYPIYPAGNAYVMSMDTVPKILNVAPHYPYVPIEDAFIPGILASICKIRRWSVGGFTRWSEEKPDSCDFVNDLRYSGNNLTTFEMQMIWRDIRDRGRDKCEEQGKDTVRFQ